jgi:hypothetical protein
MKYLLYLTMLCSISGCFVFNNETLMNKKMLPGGLTVKLYYSRGGRTAPGVIWIKKVTRDGQSTTIGKIRGFTGSESTRIRQIDSNHISVNFINKTDFEGLPLIFVINLNKKIKSNDESSFNRSK